MTVFFKGCESSTAQQADTAMACSLAFKKITQILGSFLSMCSMGAFPGVTVECGIALYLYGVLSNPSYISDLGHQKQHIP